ncbi:hypothetical protein IOD13_18960 [Brevibacterium casei]|nr:hypothetical protein [Brevibacterium casei]
MDRARGGHAPARGARRPDRRWAPPLGADERSRSPAKDGQDRRGKAPRLSGMVVDVSAEVVLLSRLLGVPVTVIAQAGERTDAAHRQAYALADALLVPCRHRRPPMTRSMPGLCRTRSGMRRRRRSSAGSPHPRPPTTAPKRPAAAPLRPMARRGG